MSNKNWHRLNFSNDIRTDTHHLWQCSSNINSTLQLHLGDIMNKQRFSAAAFIKKKWLKWRTPLASGGLMTPRYLLLFAMAEGTSLSYRSGFLLAPDEESSITGHSQTVRSYSAPSRGKWKRRGPRVPASTTGTGGSTRWHLAWWCWWCPLVCVCACVTSWHVLWGIPCWLLNCPLCMHSIQPHRWTLPPETGKIHIYIMLYYNETNEYGPVCVRRHKPAVLLTSRTIFNLKIHNASISFVLARI